MADSTTTVQRSIVVGLARELYDRFVMGGWEPQDSYELIEAVLNPIEPTQHLSATEIEELIQDLLTSTEHCPARDVIAAGLMANMRNEITGIKADLIDATSALIEISGHRGDANPDIRDIVDIAVGALRAGVLNNE